MTNPQQQFREAQQRMLEKYGVVARSKFFDIPIIDGQAHALVSGEGPAVVMINGIGTPGAMWAPLMAELKGFGLIAIDLPGYGLTDTTETFTDNLRRNIVLFLSQTLHKLGLKGPAFIANSLGSLVTSWLSLDQPDKVSAMIHVGCPAIVFETSAPLPMRLLSVKYLGRFITWMQPPSNKQVEQLAKTVNEYPLVSELENLLVMTERLPAYRESLLSTLNKLIRLRGNRPAMSLKADELAVIEHPTQIFWGRNDPFGSVNAGRQMVEVMPNAELHVVDGGHTPWLKYSKQIAPSASRFLNQYVKP